MAHTIIIVTIIITYYNILGQRVGGKHLIMFSLLYSMGLTGLKGFLPCLAEKLLLVVVLGSAHTMHLSIARQ